MHPLTRCGGPRLWLAGGPYPKARECRGMPSGATRDSTARASRDVRWFTTIDSTNRYLLEAAREGAPEGTVAVADEQTAGRGRLGRSWIAPPGASLLVSTLVRPALAPEALSLVTMAAGLACIAAVRELGGIEAGLKWPNDVVVDDRKLAGILAEKDADAVVVGMGCNVHWDTFPAELASIATACNRCTDRVITREQLLARVARGVRRATCRLAPT